MRRHAKRVAVCWGGDALPSRAPAAARRRRDGGGGRRGGVRLRGDPRHGCSRRPLEQIKRQEHEALTAGQPAQRSDCRTFATASAEFAHDAGVRCRMRTDLARALRKLYQVQARGLPVPTAYGKDWATLGWSLEGGVERTVILCDQPSQSLRFALLYPHRARILVPCARSLSAAVRDQHGPARGEVAPRADRVVEGRGGLAGRGLVSYLSWAARGRWRRSGRAGIGGGTHGFEHNLPEAPERARSPGQAARKGRPAQAAPGRASCATRRR